MPSSVIPERSSTGGLSMRVGESWARHSTIMRARQVESTEPKRQEYLSCIPHSRRQIAKDSWRHSRRPTRPRCNAIRNRRYPTRQEFSYRLLGRSPSVASSCERNRRWRQAFLFRCRPRRRHNANRAARQKLDLPDAWCFGRRTQGACQVGLAVGGALGHGLLPGEIGSPRTRSRND